MKNLPVGTAVKCIICHGTFYPRRRWAATCGSKCRQICYRMRHGQKSILANHVHAKRKYGFAAPQPGD